MTKLDIKFTDEQKRAFRAAATQGYSVAWVCSLPDQFISRLAALCPDGETCVDDVRERFAEIHEDYHESQKAAVEAKAIIEGTNAPADPTD